MEASAWNKLVAEISKFKATLTSSGGGLTGLGGKSKGDKIRA